MVYISLLSGSTGFIYFIYTPRNFPYSTSLWSECRTLALEALDLSSSLLSEKPPLDVSRDQCCVCQGQLALLTTTLWMARSDCTICWVSKHCHRSQSQMV